MDDFLLLNPLQNVVLWAQYQKKKVKSQKLKCKNTLITYFCSRNV